MYPKPRHNPAIFIASKLGDFDPQIPGRICPQTDIERQQTIVPNEPVLIAQLTTRRGWPDSKGRLALEAKGDRRARGLRSPDRADAVLVCMVGGYLGGIYVAPMRRRVWGDWDALGGRDIAYDEDGSHVLRRERDECERIAQTRAKTGERASKLLGHPGRGHERQGQCPALSAFPIIPALAGAIWI